MPRKKKHLAIYDDTWFRCLADRNAWEKPTGRTWKDCGYYKPGEVKGRAKGIQCHHLAGGDCKAPKVRQAAFHIYFVEYKKARGIK
jgi:hypothetical protein